MQSIEDTTTNTASATTTAEDLPATESPAAQKGEYSSELYKLEVKNLPKSFGFADFKKFLTSLSLKFVKIKSPNGSGFAFVTFVDEQAKLEAQKILNESKFKGRQLEAVHAKPALDPILAAKRKNESKQEPSKHLKNEDPNLTPEEKVQNSATPLWNLSYKEQCEQKLTNIKNILRKTHFKMEKTNEDIFFWLQKQKQAHEGMCCRLEDIIESPIIEKYRNKCEFTIGYDLNETKSVIGFRLGDYKSGSNEVVEPFCCRHIPEEMFEFIRVFKSYINQSEYKAYNVRTHEGHWRQLTIRTNRSRDLLAIVIFDKQDLSDDKIADEKKKLAAYFDNLAQQNSIRIKGLLFNLNTNRSGISKMDNLDLLVGEDCLYETMLDLKFRISPLAFFQSNTEGAEVLYKKIGENCELDANTILLDICCGTGTIGLTLAKHVKKVIGVEMVPEAIEDAKLNAKLNGIENVEFHCGKAEDVLQNILKQFDNSVKITAIVDPPRAGLHAKVIQTLRRLETLDSLIYVSCNPELAMTNFVDLARARSKQYANKPFVPLKAIAVDMFPHTTHCELIVYFKRYTNDLITSDN